MYRCIDGYSRKILWLEVAASNHSPGVIAGYFVSAAETAGGYPSVVRTDCGTENGIVAGIQLLAVGSRQGHVYGTSPGNQRIEGWWSFFRRNHCQWWIELFEHLVACNAFQPGNVIELECLRFCFMIPLQHELNDIRSRWNTHRIRPTVGARCPAGIPDRLYYLPIAPAVDCLVHVDMALPDELMNRIENKVICSDQSYGDYFHYLCQRNNWAPPSNVNDALALYFNILPALRQ